MTHPDQEYEQTYAEHWRELVEGPDGELNRDQVMRELHDYWVVMGEVSRVYSEVTAGRFSKPNTAADCIAATVGELGDEAIAEALLELADDLDCADDRNALIERATEIYPDAAEAYQRGLELRGAYVPVRNMQLPAEDVQPDPASATAAT